MDLIYTEKKTSQTATTDKDGCDFSVVYGLLKIKSKAYIFKKSLKFLSGRINCIDKKVLMWYNDFAFHIDNRVNISKRPTWIRKTEI